MTENGSSESIELARLLDRHEQSGQNSGDVVHTFVATSSDGA
jgi:hypothetical protein